MIWQYAMGDHLSRPLSGFFCRLKQKAYVLRRLFPRKTFRGGQQHSHMGVMSAGMHDSVMPGRLCRAAFFLPGQRVHVCPQ